MSVVIGLAVVAIVIVFGWAVTYEPKLDPKYKKLLDDLENEIKPPRWWILHTPYTHTEFVGSYCVEEVLKVGKHFYIRECTISLMEWQEKYELKKRIAELEAQLEDA